MKDGSRAKCGKLKRPRHETADAAKSGWSTIRLLMCQTMRQIFISGERNQPNAFT